MYATDANSTAYKYPLADASILRVKGKPAGERARSGPGCCGGHRRTRRLSLVACRASPAARHVRAPLCAVEVALDGTVYDLETGKVLSWCPKNTLVRAACRAAVGGPGRTRTRACSPAVCLPLPRHPPSLIPPRHLSSPHGCLQARQVLGGLKDKTEPQDLPVYPTRVQGGKVYVKFV